MHISVLQASVYEYESQNINSLQIFKCVNEWHIIQVSGIDDVLVEYIFLVEYLCFTSSSSGGLVQDILWWAPPEPEGG